MKQRFVFAVVAAWGVGAAWVGCSSSKATGTGGTSVSSSTSSTVSTGSTGGGGSGGNGTLDLACHAPATAPSNGSCVMVQMTGGGGGTGPGSDAGTDAGSGAGGGGSGGGGGAGPMGIQCNPVTNAGCTGGATCDVGNFDDNGNVIAFVCFPPPNAATVCEMCDPNEENPPFCGPRTTCFPTNTAGTVAECAQYCCTDADCGAGGTCATMVGGESAFGDVVPNLGICTASAGG